MLHKIFYLFCFGFITSCSLDEIPPRTTFNTIGETEIEGEPVKILSESNRIFIAGMKDNYPFTVVIDSIGRLIETHDVPQLIRDQFLKVDIFDFVKGNGRFFMAGTREPNPGGDEDRMIICTSNTSAPENWKKELAKSSFQAILSVDFFDNALFAVGFDAHPANDGRSGEAAAYQYSTDCDDIDIFKGFNQPVRSKTSGDQAQFIFPSSTDDSYLLVGVADLEIPTNFFDFKLAKDIFIIKLDKNLDFVREHLAFFSNARHKITLNDAIESDDGKLLLLFNEYNDFDDVNLNVLEFDPVSFSSKRHRLDFGRNVSGASIFQKNDKTGFFVVGNQLRSDPGTVTQGFTASLDNDFIVQNDTYSIYEDIIENRFINSAAWSERDDGYVITGEVIDGGIKKIFVIKTDKDGKVSE